MAYQPWFLGDASDLATAIVRGEFSPTQALQRTLADVQALNPTLNAVCLLAPEVGLAQAARLGARGSSMRLSRAARHWSPTAPPRVDPR